MNAISFSWLLVVVFPIIALTDASWVTGNQCWSMPCLNGGSCFGSAYTYLCVCPIKYSGALCEKRLGICQENPCGNRGLCIERSLTTFECRCYYDYIGRTCDEQVINKDRNIWSSLLPIHTRILFTMLQEAYRVKAKEKVIPIPKNGQIDFNSLLSTPTPMTTVTEATMTTTNQIETTERELIIQANDIQLEKIFSEQSAVFTEQSSDFEQLTTDESVENITTRSIEQSQSDSFQTTDDREMINIITSTSVPGSNDDEDENTITLSDLMEATISSTESIVLTTTQSIDFTSSDIDNDDEETDSLEQTTTLPIHTSASSSSPATTTHNAHSHLLSKLCQQLFSHILPNTSFSSNSSLMHSNKNQTANILLSWLSKQLNSSKSTTTTTTTSTLPTFIVNKIQPSVPLQRIDLDDILHQMDQSTDNESVHR